VVVFLVIRWACLDKTSDCSKRFDLTQTRVSVVQGKQESEGSPEKCGQQSSQGKCLPSTKACHGYFNDSKPNHYWKGGLTLGE